MVGCQKELAAGQTGGLTNGLCVNWKCREDLIATVYTSAFLPSTSLHLWWKLIVVIIVHFGQWIEAKLHSRRQMPLKMNRVKMAATVNWVATGHPVAPFTLTHSALSASYIVWCKHHNWMVQFAHSKFDLGVEENEGSICFGKRCLSKLGLHALRCKNKSPISPTKAKLR